MTDIAELVFEINSESAVQARKNLDDLTKSSDRVETSARKVRTASEQAGIGISSNSSATARATKTATEHAMAMSQAEKVMRGSLVTRGESITLLLRNSQVQAKVAADEIAAAKSAASATAKAEQERTAAWKRSQAVQAEIMRERVALAKQAEQQEAAAAKSAANYGAKVDRLRATLDPFAAIQTTLAQRTKLLDDALRAGAIGADQHAAMLSRVTKAATSGLLGIDKYSGGLKNGGQYATQFSYQLNDIVTGLMSGQKPMQVLAQQGGQLFQIFQMAAMEAGGFKAALRALYLEMAPLLATFGLWIAGLAAAGSAVLYLVNQHNKQKKALADLNAELKKQREELEQISPLMFDSSRGADMAAEGLKNFDNWLRTSNVSLAKQNELLRENALRKLNDKAMEAAEKYSAAQKAFDKVNKPGPAMMSSGAPGGFGVVAPAVASDPKNNKFYKDAAAALKEAREQYEAINKYRNQAYMAPEKAFGDQTKAASSVAKATKAVQEQTRAIELNNETISASTVVWPEAAAAAEAYKKQQDAVKAATDSSIKTFDEQTRGLVRMSSALESLAVDFEDAARQAYGIRASIEDIGYAIKNGDWTGAFAGLFSALDQVQKAFADGATSAQKFAAISGVGQGVGSLIGGKTGSAISGAASGAQAGFQLGGPWGAAAGAALGGLTSILGASAAKAEAKMEALRKGVEDLRADNKTSSGSIAGALADANANWNADLEYTSQMVTSLRSIDNQIGTLANALARQISGGSLMSTKGLGIGSTSSQGSLATGIGAAGLTGAALAGGTSLLLSGFAGALALGPIGLVAGAVGALVGALTKTKKTTEVLDQGLQFTASTFDEITKGGVTGSSYADLVTTTKKSLLGIGLSTKVNTSTVTGGLDPALASQITGVVEALGNGVLSAASVFGVEATKAAETALGSAVVDLGKLSLKDLKPDEIAAVLQATFDKVGDQLAAAGVPGLDALAQVGEGAFETLTRVAREYQVVDTSLAAIGKTFGMVGVESLAARDNLVQLFGGLDAFSSATSFFASNFLTDAEQLAPVIKAVNDNLKAYGLSAESSRDTFKALVLAQDLTTEAGRNTYAALLAVAPAFDKVADAAEKASASRRELEIQLLDAMGKTDEAAKARLEIERQGVDESLRYLFDQIQAEKALTAAREAASVAAVADAEAAAKMQDLWSKSTAAAIETATQAAERQAEASKTLGDGFAGLINKFYELSKSLNEFADSLGVGELSGLSGNDAYRATRSRLMGASGEQTQDAIRAFLAASREVSATDQAYRLDVAFAESIARQRAIEASGSAVGIAELFSRAMASQAAGFATGGSFEVGGSGPADSKLFSLALSPGEMVNVQRPGSANDNSEMAALRQEVRELRQVIANGLVKVADNVNETNDFLRNGTVTTVGV